MFKIKNENYISKLPREVLQHCFSFLEKKKLLDLALVCKSWKEMSEANTLWKPLGFSSRSSLIEGTKIAYARFNPLLQKPKKINAKMLYVIDALSYNLDKLKNSNYIQKFIQNNLKDKKFNPLAYLGCFISKSKSIKKRIAEEAMREQSIIGGNLFPEYIHRYEKKVNTAKEKMLVSIDIAYISASKLIGDITNEYLDQVNIICFSHPAHYDSLQAANIINNLEEKIFFSFKDEDYLANKNIIFLNKDDSNIEDILNDIANTLIHASEKINNYPASPLKISKSC